MFFLHLRHSCGNDGNLCLDPEYICDCFALLLYLYFNKVISKKNKIFENLIIMKLVFGNYKKKKKNTPRKLCKSMYAYIGSKTSKLCSSPRIHKDKLALRGPVKPIPSTLLFIMPACKGRNSKSLFP